MPAPAIAAQRPLSFARRECELCVFAAADEAALLAQLQQVQAYIESNPGVALLDAPTLPEAVALAAQVAPPSALRWEDIPHVDRISIELGFRLVYLADGNAVKGTSNAIPVQVA